MSELNAAQQAAWDFAIACAEEHPRASAEIASYPCQKGKDGAINWRDYCYVPINVGTSVTNRIPAISEIDSIQLARRLCGSLAWPQAQVVVEFAGNPPIYLRATTSWCRPRPVSWPLSPTASPEARDPTSCPASGCRILDSPTAKHVSPRPCGRMPRTDFVVSVSPFPYHFVYTGWATVFNDLKCHGCIDIMIAPTHGLKGMGEALVVAWHTSSALP